MIGKGLTRRPWVRVSALVLSALGILCASHIAANADGDDKSNKGEFIPTGVRITPSAAKGSIFQPLNPGLASDPTFTVGQAVTTAVSPDGKTLLILTSGYNSQNFASGPNAGNTNPAESNEYIFVFDISGGKPLQTQVLQVPNAFDGLAFSTSSKEFCASGGPDDDAQDGPDHVDAHRSVAFIAGPYVKQGAMVSTKYTTVSMIATIVDILGIQHLGTYDALDRPMTDAFSKSAKKWDFTSIVPDILRTMTQLPLPADNAKNSPKKDALSAFYARPRHDANYWAEKTAGFNFDQADQVNASNYNLILWKGLVGDNVAYPAERDGRDLSKNRGALLKQWRESRIREFTQERAAQSGGGN